MGLALIAPLWLHGNAPRPANVHFAMTFHESLMDGQWVRSQLEEQIKRSRVAVIGVEAANSTPAFVKKQEEIFVASLADFRSTVRKNHFSSAQREELAYSMARQMTNDPFQHPILAAALVHNIPLTVFERHSEKTAQQIRANKEKRNAGWPTIFSQPRLSLSFPLMKEFIRSEREDVGIRDPDLIQSVRDMRSHYSGSGTVFLVSGKVHERVPSETRATTSVLPDESSLRRLQFEPYKDSLELHAAKRLLMEHVKAYLGSAPANQHASAQKAMDRMVRLSMGDFERVDQLVGNEPDYTKRVLKIIDAVNQLP